MEGVARPPYMQCTTYTKGYAKTPMINLAQRLLARLQHYGEGSASLFT